MSNITSLDKRARRIALAEIIKACASELHATGETHYSGTIASHAQALHDHEREMMREAVNHIGSFVLMREPEETGTNG